VPEAVIVATARTPIGRAFKGSLVDARPDDMGGFIVQKLMEKVPEVDPGSVEDLMCGAANGAGEQSMNLARQVGLLGGLPDTVPGTVSGRPPRSATCRARFMLCSPAPLAAPTITSSTSAGSTSGAFSMSRCTMKPPMSSGRASTSEPLKARPIGVRAVATMTASGMWPPYFLIDTSRREA